MISSTYDGIADRSVSITGGLVEPDIVSVEQPTIIETEAFGLQLSTLCWSGLDLRIHDETI